MEIAEENVEVSSRMNTEHPDNDLPVRQVEIEKWVKLGFMYFCTFLLLVFWQKFGIPLETAIFPLVIGDAGILFTSVYNLKSCEE